MAPSSVTPSQAGILSIDQVAERAEVVLRELYASTANQGVKCTRRQKREGHGGFLLACSSAASAGPDLWFAFTSDGERVALAPVSEGARRLSASAKTKLSQATGGVDLISNLNEPLAEEVKAFARSNR